MTARPDLITIARNKPEGGTENWVALDIEDPLRDVQNLIVQGVQQIGLPLFWNKISGANAAEGDATAIFPDDGDGIVDETSAGGTEDDKIFLDGTTLPNPATNSLDYVGLYVAVLTGAAAGQVREITAYAHTGGAHNAEATVTPNWTTNPVAGDTYALLVPCWKHNTLHLKSEFEDAAGVQPDADIALMLFGIPLTVVGFDGNHTIRNRGVTSGHILESGYRHGQMFSVQSRGAIGAKVYVHNISGTAGKKLSLWAGVS